MMIKKLIKKTLAFAVAGLIGIAGMAPAAFASDKYDVVPDLPGGPYSLTVKMQSSNPDGSETGIAGASLSVNKVADLVAKNRGAYYTMVAPYADTGIVMEEMTASESNEAAKTFAAIEKEPDFTGITAEDGTMTLADLEPGAYLVQLTGYSDADSRYTAMDPFLVLVPDIVRDPAGNSWDTAVTAVPKIAVSPADYIETDPPVSKQVTGEKNCREVFTFRLMAADPMNPMPAGSRNGIKEVSIKGEGKTEFGVWRYTEPGVYEYTVSEVAGSSRNYSYDKTVYHLRDRVYYKGSKMQLDRLITDDRGNEYTESVFKFVNKYNPVLSPKTGDILGFTGALIVLLAGGVLAVMISRRRRHE